MKFYDYVPEGEQYQHMRDEMAGFAPDGTYRDYIPEEPKPQGDTGVTAESANPSPEDTIAILERAAAEAAAALAKARASLVVPPPVSAPQPQIDPNVLAAVEAAKVSAGVVEGYCPSGCGYGGPDKTNKQLQAHIRMCSKMEEQKKSDEARTREEYAKAAAAATRPVEEEDDDFVPDSSIYRVKE